MNCGAKKKHNVTLTRHMIYEQYRVWTRQKKRIIQRSEVDICIRRKTNHQKLNE